MASVRRERARIFKYRRMTRRSRLTPLAKKVIVALAGVFLLAALGSGVYFVFFPPSGTPAEPGRSLAEILHLPPPLSEEKIVISLGQNLAGILSAWSFSPEEIHRLRQDASPVFNLDTVRAGRELRLYRGEGGRVKFLEYDIDDRNFLRIERDGDVFRPAVLAYAVETRRMRLEGVVEDILISAFNAAGESDLLALDFAEVFAWDVDFYIDLRKGDRFRVFYERIYRGGVPSGYGRILAAEFWNQGRHLQAFRFTYSDTNRSDYFDADGNSLRKEFMKSPLKYGRITSRFTSSRLHPIRKIYRAHYGVDYAAPVGTPVRATADARVLAAGWNGGAGRMIKLQHKGGYQTVYMHLSRLAEGIKVGEAVAAGQTIGYVGSSGESTGPHLDYRILHHGKYINPQASRFNPAEPLRPEFREAFDAEREALLRDLYPPPLRLEFHGPFLSVEMNF